MIIAAVCDVISGCKFKVLVRVGGSACDVGHEGLHRI